MFKHHIRFKQLLVLKQRVSVSELHTCVPVPVYMFIVKALIALGI